MPAVKLYLDDDSYEAYKKLKLLIKQINAVKNTKLSVSNLVAAWIKAAVEKLEECLDPEFLRSKSLIKIDMPALEINIGSVEFRESEPSPPRQMSLPIVMLWSLYKDWKRRFLVYMRIRDPMTKANNLTKLRDDIAKEIEKYKRRKMLVPKDLMDNIAKLLAKIDMELDALYNKLFGVKIEQQSYEYT